MTRRQDGDRLGRLTTPSASDEWLASVAASAAADGQAPADLLGEYLPLLADAAINGRRPDAWELDAVRELGRRAAAQGVGARRAVDLYLSAAWRLWRQLPVVVRWLGANSSVYGLLEELGQSAEAMSEIVKAVKTYSYLDQAPIQDVDVVESLENTLVLLRPRIDADLIITRDYADDVPRIEAYGSELNQVWTNIIENAIDATEGHGELSLRAYTADNNVVAEVIDDGPGIPSEIQPRIFEPFFTTKPPGVGTGLGLHIAYNIVVHRHRGQIQVASRPGETRLRVILPIRLAGSDASAT